MKLKDKVTIVTGGARGIGRKTAQIFAKQGASVVVGDLLQEEGQDTVAAIEDAGGKAVFVQVDVANLDQVKSLVETALKQFGKVDILINNAGITRDSTLLKMTQQEWDQVMEVNLKGVFHCVKKVAPVMVDQGRGTIINASSVVALYGNFGQTNYVASKAGIIGMTKVWARELGPKGIRVNAIAPGFIKTSLTEQVPEKVLKGIKEKTPLGRLGEPEEVAKAYLFLASEDASFINGAVLSVDGGLVI